MKHWVRVILEDAVSNNSGVGDNVLQGLNRIIAILEAHEDHQFRTLELEEIAEAIVDCSNLEDLAQLVWQATTGSGFNDFTLFVAKQGATGPFSSRICTSLNTEWIARYSAKSYQYIDPVMSRAFAQDGVFLYSDLRCNAPAIQSFWQDAAEHGVGQNGICYASTVQGGARLGMSYSTTYTEEKANALARLNGLDLIVIAILAFDRFSALACPMPVSDNILSDAELRFLYFLATKSDPGCVNERAPACGSGNSLEVEILSKLNVKTIVQAVAVASSKHWFDRLPYDANEVTKPFSMLGGRSA